jgi:hypothetical protein
LVVGQIVPEDVEDSRHSLYKIGTWDPELHGVWNY